MSLYWERLLPNSSTPQNVNHSESGITTTADVQQNSANSNWDCINLGNVPPQQQQFHWAQQSGGNAGVDRSADAPEYDPYGAAVMGGYQQGTHNVVYPFQQQSEASSGRYTAASQSSSSQPVEQNYYYHQQQQPQQSPPPLACSPQPLTQQVQHTLIPTRQHAKISSLQEKQPEPQTIASPPLPPTSIISPTVASFTSPSFPLSSTGPQAYEPIPVPLAVISPAVVPSAFLTSQAVHYPPVVPFGLRSVAQNASQLTNGGTAGPSASAEVGRPRSSGNEVSSRRSSLSYLAVQPVLSVQYPGAAQVPSGAAVRTGDSAQVTPESTYSVDTFGSGISSTDQTGHLQSVNISSADTQQVQHQNSERTEDNWEDDWERTEHPETGAAREVTPSDVASQTQSEPPGYPSSFPDTPCATREGSVAPATDADSALHRSELGTDVARVAPVSATSTSVVGIQRHEETSRSQDHVPVAVAQVAPLRPEPESLQNAPIPVTQAPATQVTIPNEAAVAGASDPEPVDSPGTAATINDVPVHTNDPNVSVALSLPAEPSNRSQQTVQSPHATPEPTSAETMLSPVGIQATSTPNAVGDTKTVRSSEIRAENQNRESSSREPEDSHGQVNAHSGLAAAAEQSDSTTGSLSTRNGPERRSVQSRYRKFKEHFSGIMGRLDQYRAEPPRSEFRSSSRTGNPLMANAANRSAEHILWTLTFEWSTALWTPVIRLVADAYPSPQYIAASIKMIPE
ncbi:hypothetical protein OESDEN_01813 [Oesophagostomum dentatum]|uniref:Uncharacterized protein n=1 Tax=Oesophagostomum dentatum TaxID=61180 RepID=A0A0B1TL08_OESDE|nr:hypothetical protein OESDEN_01813 [Oesophagostomum dentatum]